MAITTTTIESSVSSIANTIAYGSNTTTDLVSAAVSVDSIANGLTKSYSSLSAFPSATQLNIGQILVATDTGFLYCNKTGSSWTKISFYTTAITLDESPTSAASNYLVNSLYRQALTVFNLIEAQSGWTLFGWGANADGQLGLGSTTNYSSPVQVGTLTDWKQVNAATLFSAAVKMDGTLWSWGNNQNGALGLGDTTNRSSPVQVGTLTNWKQVSCGYNHTATIKTDGTLWSWGNNYYGQLGLGDTTNYSSPIQVGTLNNWKQVSVGDNYTTLSIKSNGTLWAWGVNTDGRLGLGDTTNYSSPVQVGTLANWKQVSTGNSHMAAIKTDGTLWASGSNDYGQLGLGDTTNYSSPVQVGSLTDWKQVSCGYKQTAVIKTDGTLWSWGQNTSGQLGLGNTTNYSSPVQVGSLTNWKQVSTGTSTTAATKTDGTLWTWGNNQNGTLGQGSTTNYSSPVQVGTLTNWKQVSISGYVRGLATTYPISSGYFSQTDGTGSGSY